MIGTSNISRKQMVAGIAKIWWENRKINITRRQFESFIDQIEFFPRKDDYPDSPIGVEDCYMWMGTSVNGYGRYRGAISSNLVHRIAYEIVNGKIEPGLQIRHLCNNSMCCCPDHLMPGTAKENELDKKDAKYQLAKDLLVTPQYMARKWWENLEKLQKIKIHKPEIYVKYMEKQEECFKLLEQAFTPDKLMNNEKVILAEIQDMILEGMNDEEIKGGIKKGHKIDSVSIDSISSVRRNLIDRRLIDDFTDSTDDEPLESEMQQDEEIEICSTEFKLEENERSSDLTPNHFLDSVTEDESKKYKNENQVMFELLCEQDNKGSGHGYDWIVREIKRRIPKFNITEKMVINYENKISNNNSGEIKSKNQKYTLPLRRVDRGPAKLRVTEIVCNLLCETDSDGVGHSYSWISNETRLRLPTARSTPTSVRIEEWRIRNGTNEGYLLPEYRYR